MSAGQVFEALEDGSCGVCGKRYRKGAEVQWWDEVVCHQGCVDEEQTTTVLVARSNSGAPIAIPEDVVIASERPYRAYKLHMAGHSWEMVALAENYPDWRACRADVKRYLDQGAAIISETTKREMVTLELARYDAYTQALWADAMKGSVPAINTSLSVSSMRVKLTHMDADFIDDPEAGQQGRTVVVGTGEDEYQAGLEAAADEGGHH